jgi:membrane-associated phospholipid phosphatase
LPPKNLVPWLGLIILAVLLILATKFFSLFPGDVAVARWVQALTPADLSWAQVVSRAVDFPWILLVLAGTLALSWLLAGWRAAVLAAVSLAAMMALGSWLSPVIARPRPTPALVRVWRPLPGYSFPSLSALYYAATFGFLAVLAAMESVGSPRLLLLAGFSAPLVLCFLARVALGAHWPSDVLISYYLGLLWAAVLLRFGLRTRGDAAHNDQSRSSGQA